MSFFTGAAGPQRRVDLRGKSRQEETREQVLERTRLERERRQRQKLEQKSALAIQARWRQKLTARKYAEYLRKTWANQYEGLPSEESGRNGLNQEFLYDTICIPVLLRFYDQTQVQDRARLAAVCRALSYAARTGACPLLEDAATAAAAATACSSTPVSADQEAAADGPTAEAMALFRVNKLAALCLSTLATTSTQATPELSSSLVALASSQQPTAAFLEFLIHIVNPDTWKGSVGQQQPAQAGAAAVLRHLYNTELFSHLRVLLQAVPSGLPGKTAVEVLVTQVTVRCITLQLVPTQTQAKPAAVTAAGQPDAAGSSSSSSYTQAVAEPVRSHFMQYGVSQLLFVHGLWAKCGSLAPVMSRLCTLSLTELCQQLSSRNLLAALPQSVTVVTASSSKHSNAHRAVAGMTAAAAAASSLTAWMDNILQAVAAGTLLKGVSSEQAVAVQAVGAVVLVLEASRQLEVIQKRALRLDRQKRRTTGQVMAGGNSPAAAAAAVKSSHTAFVPGAGYMRGAQAVDIDMEDGSSSEDDVMIVAEVAEPAAVKNSSAASSEAGEGGSGSRPAQQVTRNSNKTARQQPVAASAYSAEQTVSNQQTANTCFQLLAGTSQGMLLLRRLALLLLPATTAVSAAQQQQQSHAAVMPGSAAQQQLCELLWKLSRPKQHRQRIWLGMSVGVCLAPRLWFSYILPLHASTPGGFLTAGSSSTGGTAATGSASSGGSTWVQPLLVLAQCYSAALSFTHLEDFYADAAALVPLSQLYSASNPAAGLVLLLKAAVWQVLWCGTSSRNPSYSSSLQQQQLQQLKRSFGELGGLLLCQLHDRNCTRQYCPPEAFLAEALPPGRLLQEVAARGGIDAFAGIGDSSDDEATHATPLEQQQQWQRQRQQAVSGGDAMDIDTPGGVSRGPGGAMGPAGHPQGGTASESEGEEEDLPAGNAAAIGPGATSNRVTGFGFGPHDPVQQRRQQLTGGSAAPAAAAASAAGGASSSSSSAGSRVWLVLQHAPCLIPFQDRVKLFQAVVSTEKEKVAAEVATQDEFSMFFMGAGLSENRFITIRRDHLLEDSLSQLNAMGTDRLKGRLRIAYVNEAGASEAGIDGGGLFKDFMEELLKKGFSPQSQLFMENSQRQLYPNPAAYQLVLDAEAQLLFLGRMLGKSLYEGMLLELPLAAFFLKKMRGDVCDINDLLSLDPEVYKHLLQLKHFKGDFADLSLSFTATVVDATPAGSSSSAAPHSQEVELKRGGRDIAVRADNVIEYIHRLADFRLNRQMDQAAGAFLTGFFELIKPRWVRMFNEAELQMLISGSEEGIDVDDLVAHVNYAGGYHEEHPVILTLWDAVRTFTSEQQRQFLKFITSCSRAPLLGFAYLEPQLCIQMSGSVLNADSRERLPTAATCMNLLKLPPYKDFDEMRSKLLYAITAGAGFELS